MNPKTYKVMWKLECVKSKIVHKLNTTTAEMTLIFSGARWHLRKMEPRIYLIGFIIRINTQHTPSKMNFLYPDYLWFAPTDAGECVLWVHLIKSIMFGCNNQLLILKIQNGSQLNAI